MPRARSRLWLVMLLTLLPAGCGRIVDFKSTPPPSCTTCPSQVLFATGVNQIMEFQVNPNTGALSALKTITGPNQSIGILATSPNLYVSDFLNDAVDVFSISNTGALSAVAGSPFGLGGTSAGAGGLAISITGPYLYATDLNAGKVVGWVSNNGVLTAIPGSPFAVGNTPERAVEEESPAGNLFFM